MATDMVGNYLKKRAYGSSATSDMQTIPARHGVATFVPAGSTIKIVNTSGTQIVDTWAFALPNPPEANPKTGKPRPAAESAPEKPQEPEQPKQAPKKNTRKSKGGLDLPSQEDAEMATSSGIPEEADAAQKKSGWSSYLPSFGLKGRTTEARQQETKENSKTWGSYLGGAGQGITSYVPSRDDVSGFASRHYRDKDKSYVEQLADFSRTPVGSAGISALSGSGYASSIYAGYSAWQSNEGGDAAPMEYLSMPHTRASTEHIIPRVNDVLVSNLREPMLAVVEDSSPGIHDTLMAACDPQRYKGLGVEDWDQHGSCAENLVLALKELNERAGLKGPKGIGAEVTVNAVPAPFNLFMNIPWTNSGDLKFDSPGGKKGDYIRLRAMRDVVVVMSACPQDVLVINAKDPQDAHFIVSEDDDEDVEGADVRDRLNAAESQKSDPKPQRPSPAPRTSTPKKANGTSAAPSKPAAAEPAPAQAKKPAASKTPIGTKKTPIGQTKAKPASTATAKPASTTAQKPRTPIGTTKTPKSAPAPAAKATEDAGEKATEEKTEAPKPAAEKKKPRKLVRASPAPSKAGD